MAFPLNNDIKYFCWACLVQFLFVNKFNYTRRVKHDKMLYPT